MDITTVGNDWVQVDVDEVAHVRFGLPRDLGNGFTSQWLYVETETGQSVAVQMKTKKGLKTVPIIERHLPPEADF